MNLVDIDSKIGGEIASKAIQQDPDSHVSRSEPTIEEHIHIGGKFLFDGCDKFWVRGVTYGTFPPDDQGYFFPAKSTVEADFEAISRNGFNTVRVYTVPPNWLIELAEHAGLRLIIGLPWEQHIAFLTDDALPDAIRSRLRNQIRSCRKSKAILAFAIGNEIPAPIVRWHGKRKIESFLKSIHEIVREEAPDCLSTYVNYPTTEFLELSFLDFVSFNVYLENRETLSSYLKRLQNLAGDKPLLMAEIGLDSRRNGEAIQADSLAWQIRTAFEEGCVGACVFAWTDTWYRGGHLIDDWDFGLTDRDGQPKQALSAVKDAMAVSPGLLSEIPPKISVVVCSYNGAPTIRDTFEGLARLNYPNFEVIVIDDGSTDGTAKIAGEYNVRLKSTPNQGLSAARNEGLAMATGEIVVYTDDDAYPDPDWLTYLAAAFQKTDHACIGGPNLVPKEDGWVGQCVANSPGGPLQVLVTDELAEHVPGCNMAFRASALRAIGGFDSRFRAAGDDVDVCWRLQDKGQTIGFCAAAQVWHHRRSSPQRYWKQQVGYGKAEALLEGKWPARFNPIGHITWGGRIYGQGSILPTWGRQPRIYQGLWGTAPFQGLYQPPSSLWMSLVSAPEWLLLTLIGMGTAMIGLAWPPFQIAVPVALLMLAAFVAGAAQSTAKARFPHGDSGWKEYGLTFLFHLIQPAARLWGRIKHGLTLWRFGRPSSPLNASSRDYHFWDQDWHAAETRLSNLFDLLQQEKAVVTTGGDYDAWDLRIRGGLSGSAELLIACEEHGAGKQFIRFRITPQLAKAGLWVAGIFCAAVALALYNGNIVGALFSVAILLLYTWLTLRDITWAMDTASSAVAKYITHRDVSGNDVITEESKSKLARRAAPKSESQ